MIAGYGFDPVLKAPPGRIITVPKLIRCTVIIGVVTNSEYGTWDVLQQLRSQFIAVAVTGGNVTSPHKGYATSGNVGVTVGVVVAVTVPPKVNTN